MTSFNNTLVHPNITVYQPLFFCSVFLVWFFLGGGVEMVSLSFIPDLTKSSKFHFNFRGDQQYKKEEDKYLDYNYLKINSPILV